MALPVDIKAILDDASLTQDAAKEPISVSVYIDEDAAGNVISYVRSVFAGSTGANVRVQISYLNGKVEPRPEDDMAVIVAGASEWIGEAAQTIRAADVPVMIATNIPGIVKDMADTLGYPIPVADIVYPVAERLQLPFANKAQDLPDGPIEIDDASKMLFNERMGRWIIAACSERKLAFAVAFPFVRRPLAQDAITNTSMQNAGIGLLPIIPGADMPIMTLNQAKMLMQIAVAYGQKLDKERIPELIALVGNAFICRNIARSLTKAIPVAGWLVSGAVGFTATEAVGRAAIEYFEAGGSVAGITNITKAAAKGSAGAVQKFGNTSAGQTFTSTLKKGASGALKFVRNKATGK